MKMNKHWLEQFESKEDKQDEIIFYRKELEKAMQERIDVEKNLKAIDYRIEKLRDKLFELI